MIRICVLSILLISVFSMIGFAQETATTINVDEMAICTSVEERQPVGTDTAFVKTVGQLYCFVKVSSDSDTTSLYHAWIYNDKEMAKVELSVKGKTWRTWSSKRITEDWVGNWKVEVSSSTGDVLKTKEFVIK
jgi:hypothetical protein